MLALVLISIVIIITATYVTTYNNNKITREDVLTADMSSKTQKDFEEDFLSNFDEFKIYLSSEVEVIYKDDKVLEYGTRKFTVKNNVKENYFFIAYAFNYDSVWCLWKEDRFVLFGKWQ